MEGISANWRTSSYSDSNGGQCVEVGPAAHQAAIPGAPVRDTTDRTSPAAPRASMSGVLVRDTTDRTGPVLLIRPAAWQALTAAVREGRAAARS